MLKILAFILTAFVTIYGAVGCRATKKLQTIPNINDSVNVINPSASNRDSIVQEAHMTLQSLDRNQRNFTTFSAKIKVEYGDSKGKQSDLNAFVRLYKDSMIWASINATFLGVGVEALRVFITKDTVIILYKLDKEVEFHPFSYIEKVIHIPLTFSTLQDVIVGNPIYVGDSIVAYRRTENHILIATVGELFKNLLTVSESTNLMESSRLDDLNETENRTANFTYGGYEKNENYYFATNRAISISEKTKVNIVLSFKQYEFNNELSFRFIVPPNYKVK
ncbi:MAG: DUF4292 domain-containing protein [Ginsengibacter sp.]